MAFVEGTGDEFLLTCFVCKNPFGLVAQFCGYCQATRQQALGVERARASQQIVTESFEQAPVHNINADVNTPAAERVKKKKVRRQNLFFQNMRLRMDSFKDWQTLHSRPIGAIAGVTFVAFTYVIIQTYIFVSASPTLGAERYMYPGVTRDVVYFDSTETDSATAKTKIFPAKYLKWSASSSDRWTTRASWNGWTGKAQITFTPAGNLETDRPVLAQFSAKYESQWKVFRKITWIPSSPAAILNLTYPKDKNLSIYFNGLAAGSTYNPVVTPGEYRMFPGPLEIKYYDLTTGKLKSEYSRSFFISTSGEFSSSY
jgi:thiol-disulfide isomerase/thioredoxin